MKLIIDTDPGDDDIIAILLALSWPDTEVLAYIASFGNVDVEHTYNNILKLYGVLDKHIKACPEASARYQSLKHISTLIKGAAGPIEGPSPGNGAFFHGADGLGNISTRYEKEIPLPEPASLAHLLKIADESVPFHEHILDILSAQEDGSVTWLVLGPCSSLAVALQHDPELVKRKVARVSIMGGAVERAGNFTPVAEWNIYADPSAAHEVFNHSRDLSIFLSPLDITTKHLLQWPQYKKWIDQDFYNDESPNADPLTFFTSAFFRWSKPQTEKYCSGRFELHDPLAAWYVLCNPLGQKLSKGWEVKAVDIRIERTGEYTKGMCVVDRRLLYGDRPPPADAAIPNEPRLQEKVNTGAQLVEAVGDTEETKNTVFVVTGTPGSDALVDAMFEHIWGRKRERAWYSSILSKLCALVHV